MDFDWSEKKIHGEYVIPLASVVEPLEPPCLKDIVFVGLKRYYIEDLSVRDYCLECTTPYYCEIMGHVFLEKSWGNLLQAISGFLISMNPSLEEPLLFFRCSWTRQTIFSRYSRNNTKQVKDGLYININHTALHLCWLLQDLLDFFKIEKESVLLLIHRPCGAETKEVKSFFSEITKKKMAQYLVDVCGKEKEYVETKIIPISERVFNQMLRRFSKSYDNIFLFDDMTIFCSYAKRIREMISNSMKYSEKQKRVLSRYLDYIYNFYRL